MRAYYRIRVTKSRISPTWLCRLVPLGASPYDNSAVLLGRFPSQPEALKVGLVALVLTGEHRRS